MLILSRKIDEVLCIGDEVEVKILSSHGNQVRLGILAPKSISVDRKEIRLRKLAEKAL